MSKASRRGRRNRQRGAELQRQIVRLAKSFNLDAHNRDRGGAQHEGGDLEIEEAYYGCKRKKNLATFLKPEKREIGVFIREDRGDPMVVINATDFLFLLSCRKLALGGENE
jgi:hypothetical protein|tara:strand:+ start:8565 stop:8897 length:333 start_codon:yes stop_codon:yes gene_type:complete